MKIETLTPVHIGSGDNYLTVDFVLVGNRVVFIDALKFFQEVEKTANPIEVAQEIAKGNASVKDFIEDLSKIKEYEVPFVGHKVRREILKHIKTNGKLYIPGSTIKGAIRTALLWKAVKDDRSLLNKTIQLIKQKIENRKFIGRKELTRLDDELENIVFRKSRLTPKENDPKNDIFRVLKITDTSPFEKCKVYEIKFLGMRNFSQLVECIDYGDSAELDMGIDEYTLSFMDQKLDFDVISEATREFAEEIVKTETNRYPERTKNEFRNVLKAKGIILRIGWGTGWYSSTIGTLLKTHPEFESLRKSESLRKKLGLGRNPGTGRFSRNFPMIRRVTFDDRPLGWIAIHD
ncbi:MAG: type III-A CRISPR-associated RAMP protein Csm5 [Archaeoglobus sp.]|nr:MAG: type III-A CRISPR-associated RAMP protein Csm5 [Archaeoglobus sp.]